MKTLFEKTWVWSNKYLELIVFTHSKYQKFYFYGFNIICDGNKLFNGKRVLGNKILIDFDFYLLSVDIRYGLNR